MSILNLAVPDLLDKKTNLFTSFYDERRVDCIPLIIIVQAVSLYVSHFNQRFLREAYFNLSICVFFVGADDCMAACVR